MESSYEYRKFNYWKLAVILIVLAAIIGSSVYFGNKYYKSKLQEQFDQGAEWGASQYIAQQQQTGQVYYWDNSTGNWSLMETSFQKICGVANG